MLVSDGRLLVGRSKILYKQLQDKNMCLRIRYPQSVPLLASHSFVYDINDNVKERDQAIGILILNAVNSFHRL